jgi:AcrR family transcriptional regulator
MNEPTVRGPHAQRRAATRAKIMDSAVRCLVEFGYAATSTPLVAKIAHVSRGSLLHQFPTKVDLILAVAEHAARAQGAFIRERLAQHPPGREQFVAVIDATREMLQEPVSIALMEIMVATRNDLELAERYPGFASAVERGLHHGRQRIAASLGMADNDELEVMARLSLATLRGLAMETLFAAAPTDEADKVVAMLKRLRGQMADDILRRDL